MHAYDDHRATKIVLSIFFLLFVCYAYFELRGILFGPTITFKDHPAETSEKFIEITGNAQRIQTLTMNDDPIEVTEHGEFKESFLLAPGSNRIMFEAKDKYGNRTDAAYDIFLIATHTVSTSTLPSLPFFEPTTTATSTAGTTTPATSSSDH